MKKQKKKEEKFNCEMCGSCCKVVNCHFLLPNNLCSVYAIRPDMCKVKNDYEKNRQHCKELQKRRKWIETTQRVIILEITKKLSNKEKA